MMKFNLLLREAFAFAFPLLFLCLSFAIPIVTNHYGFFFVSFFDYILFLLLFFLLSFFSVSLHSSKKLLNVNYNLLLIAYLLIFIFSIYFGGVFFEYFAEENGYKERFLLLKQYKPYFIFSILCFLSYMSFRNKLFDNIFLVLTVFLIGYVFSMYAIGIDSRYMANNLNYGVIVMPIINLFFGSHIPIESQSQYGYYPYFLLPFLKIFGLSISNINVLFATASALSLTSIFFICYRFSYTLFYATITFSSVLFLLTFFGSAWPGELYFQYNPIRIFSPSISLLVIYFYITERFSPIHVFIILSILFFWNIDSGLPCILSFFGIIFIEAFSKRDSKFFYKLLLQFLVIFLFIVSLIQSYSYYHNDTFISLPTFFEPQIAFRSEEIFFNRPSLSMLMLLSINGLLFFYSLANFISSHNKFFLLSAYISILTFGLMAYGSRHYSTLALSVFLIPVAYTIFIYTLKELNPKKIKIFLMNLPLIFISTIFLTSIPANVSFFHTSNFITNLLKIDIKEFQIPDLSDGGSIWLSKNEMNDKKLNPKWIEKISYVEYLKKKYNLDSSKSIFVASERDHFIYLALSRPSPLRLVNWSHIPYYNQWNEVHSALLAKRFEFVISDDSYLYRFSDASGPKNFFKFESILDENYILIDSAEIGSEWFYPGWIPSKTKLYRRK